MRVVSILGATGSIGESTLDVIARHPDRFRVAALAAHRNVDRLAALCDRFRPAFAALLDADAARALERRFARTGVATRVLAGPEGLAEIAALPEADIVLAAIVGAAGLVPTLAAVRAGKRILLANKEALVIGGAQFMHAASMGKATLIPIDSEHNAIFQCLPFGYDRRPAAFGIRRILLTASGGPFRDMPISDLRSVTPDQACAHPTWRMGRKISVDSATMMNKGLEVIEAHLLFGVPAAAIEVVVHPQSIVHSLVEYLDGSVLAQLGHPDMRTPIAQALAYPDRVATGVSMLDLPAIASLTFQRPDAGRFPCLALAYAALAAGESAPIVLNAANEIAVSAFLDGKTAFTAIADTCAQVMDRLPATPVDSIDAALAVDAHARREACAILGLSGRGTIAA
jgi:1-deoxy-D-xylulose-5-phosphate reductoisomerase